MAECVNARRNATKVGNKVGSRTLAQACASLPGQIIYKGSWFNKLLARRACTRPSTNMFTQPDFEPFVEHDF